METQAKLWKGVARQEVTPQQCGRAQTLTAQQCKTPLHPPRIGRQGEVQPAYYGLSLRHSRWFKQLRRLQALQQAGFQDDPNKPDKQAHKAETWRAIRNAPGFPGGFCSWWQQQSLPPFAQQIPPLQCPHHSQVCEMFQSFQSIVRQFERQLAQGRVSYARRRRVRDIQYVFRDCRDPRAPPIDTLVNRQEAAVVEIDASENAVIFASPVDFDASRPVVSQGQPLRCIHHSDDKLWLEDISPLQVGSVIAQKSVCATDGDLLDSLRRA